MKRSMHPRSRKYTEGMSPKELAIEESNNRKKAAKKPVAMSYGGKMPKKMGMGGGMSKCRGMGAATRGGNFKMG